MQTVMKQNNCLYALAVPIGNLQDITLRALDVLTQCQVIACEDTRKTGLLIQKLVEKNHLPADLPKKTYIRADEHSTHSAIEKIKQAINNGENIALLSDAGSLSVSDPGNRIIASLHQDNIPCIPIPGPSALTTALSVCALKNDTVTFIGFLAKKGKQRTKAKELLQNTDHCLVFFESAHRIEKTLDLIHDTCPEKHVFVAREMTKLHEQYLLGLAVDVKEQLLEHFNNGSIKGEFTVAVGTIAKV